MTERDVSTGPRTAGAKTSVPELPKVAVERSALLARARAFRSTTDHQVLTVSAPAGFGKTTFVAAWAHEVRAGGSQVAWLDVDRTDSSSFRFWSLVVAALREASEVGRHAPAAPRRDGDVTFLLAMVDLLSSTDDLVIVIDNLHEVRHRGTLSDLDWLVAHLPLGCRMVLVSRSDPPLPTLQRLKLAGHLAQLRAGDLAFSLEETSLVCPDLTADERLAVWQRTEGWPALVRMVQLTPRGERPHGGTVDPLGGDIALADYLFQEAFGRQDPATQHVLLVCAVPRRVSLELAVELSSDPAAGALLDQVAHRSGLVTRHRDDASDTMWYRFHPILRGYLQGQLASRDHQSVTEAHMTSARWFLATGHGIEAVEHAMRSGDLATQEEVLASCGAALITSGEAELLAEVMETGTGHERRHGPWTQTVLAAAQLEAGRVPEAEQSLRAVATADLGEDGALNLTRLATEVHLHRRQGRPSPPGLLEAELPGDPDLEVRLLLACQRGSALTWRGAWDQAERELRVGERLAVGLGRDAAHVDCLSFLAGVASGHSDVHGVDEHARRSLALAADRGWSNTPRVAYPHLLAGFVAWQQLDPRIAEQHVRDGLACLDPSLDPTIVIGVRALSAALEFEREGEPAAADRLHSLWEEFRGQEAAPSLVAYQARADVRASLAVRRTRWAHEVERLLAEAADGTAEHLLVGAMLAEATGHGEDARRRTDRAAHLDTPALVPSTRVEAHALGARLALRAGDRRGAVALMRAALAQAAELGTLRPIVDGGGSEAVDLLRAERGRWGTEEEVADTILHRCGPAVDPPVQLTERELEVLRELPSLRTVEEIGEILYLSVNTVKTHLRGVYRKLGVSSRRQAVIEARRIGLI